MLAPDGTLPLWSDVATAHDWQALLLGNGMSINVWGGFAYHRLFDHARSDGLTADDLKLFGDTPNFELVLGDILTSIKVLESLGQDADALYDRYASIQAALGHAVREVHLRQPDVPPAALATIRSTMESFEWVFTTSYDLLLYWAMAQPTWRPFVDLFKYRGRCEFDARRCDVMSDEIPIYFLHGALHLVTGEGGATWKLKSNLVRSLLEQFGRPIPGEPKARPLLVTEGSARDKVRAIEANDYLAHALARLYACDLPLVVFGSGLSPQDDHLVDALNEHPSRPIAVSMRAGPKREIARRQADLYGRLESDELLFFDAATHPLGSSSLAAPVS
jgi:Domain of unknown function (DUF4917)